MKIIQSETHKLDTIFREKYTVDFFQREYVWQKKHLEDLLMDLSNEFIKNWNPDDEAEAVEGYDPYFMGEIVLSIKDNKNYIIDGQQRITTLTLLLIYLLNTYRDVDGFPETDIIPLICKNRLGKTNFNIDIPEREGCMKALYNNTEYISSISNPSVDNILERYNDISNSWDSRIDENNVVIFTYWLIEKVMFSKVWTNSDDFAYVIFETMNDRGLSLTQVEMLRSYILANIDSTKRSKAMEVYDGIVRRLSAINLSRGSKAEFEFFKAYFRGHYAENLSQSKGANSDFVRIGKEFHRWVRDVEKDILHLESSKDYIDFLDRINFFANVYIQIHELIQQRDINNYLYLIVNHDYGFTLQIPLILSAISYNDDECIIQQKIKIISKYITRLLSWRVWNHWMISQSALEAPIYELCKCIREKSIIEINQILSEKEMPIPDLDNSPRLNQQNKSKLRVLLSLITAIVGKNSGEPQYPLNDKEPQEVEHIWSNHLEKHPEFQTNDEFQVTRNNIGGLLVLPKSFNASYGDKDYAVKVEQYFSKNILAQSLNKKKYEHNPGFVRYIQNSELNFKPYDDFTSVSITERADLYKAILIENWKDNY